MSLSVSCLLALNTPGGPLGPSLEQEPGPPRRGCTGGRLHLRPQGCRLLFRGHPPVSPSVTWHGWAWTCPLRVRCSVAGEGWGGGVLQASLFSPEEIWVHDRVPASTPSQWALLPADQKCCRSVYICFPFLLSEGSIRP